MTSRRTAALLVYAALTGLLLGLLVGVTGHALDVRRLATCAYLAQAAPAGMRYVGDDHCEPVSLGAPMRVGGAAGTALATAGALAGVTRRGHASRRQPQPLVRR